MAGALRGVRVQVPPPTPNQDSLASSRQCLVAELLRRASDTTQWESSHDSNCSDTDGAPQPPRAVDPVLDDHGAARNSGARARDVAAATVEAVTPPASLVTPTAPFGSVPGRAPVRCRFVRAGRLSEAPSPRRYGLSLPRRRQRLRTPFARRVSTRGVYTRPAPSRARTACELVRERRPL